MDGISIISLKRKEKKLRTTSLVLIAGARELLIRWFAPSVSLQRENEMGVVEVCCLKCVWWVNG